MRYVANICILIMLAFTGTGCASSNLTYTPPAISTIDNEVALSDSFDVVWDRLVRNLATDFFVVNNIEKASRLINVSFSSGSSASFVTCGQSVREFKNARGKQTYVYDPAESTQFTFTDQGGNGFNARRTSRLDGRVNVYVAPSGTGTDVTVNSKYVVSVDQSYTNVLGQAAGAESFQFDFSTSQPFSGAGDVVCVANGEIERRILGFARE